jgi:uncharacterized protein YjbI with pentapeptide repeats
MDARMWPIRRALTAALGGAVLLLVGAWFLVSWLLGSPPRAQGGPLDTAAQLELLKLVFALVAGIGALVALVTAYRRQRVAEAAGERAERAQTHAEQVARDNAFDATERRVTDLYGQAVEQLGHDRAAVRLGGLYSLERLAQDHERHRQTVVDVACAYLRMPFEPEPSAEGRQELEVRLAAQRLLARHLRLPPDPSGSGSGSEGDAEAPRDPEASWPDGHWHGMRVELAGAVLVDLDFTGCRLRHADFKAARFEGSAKFGSARFDGYAGFDDAQFNGGAAFGQARFGERADFKNVRFGAGTWFAEARFTKSAWFTGARFGGAARFAGTRFAEDARFTGAAFGADARFAGARFGGAAWFDEVRFDGVAGLAETHFGGVARFGRARFGERAWFAEARFTESVRFDGARFAGAARFDGARFGAELDFANATACHADGQCVWPAPWELAEPADGTDMAKLVRRG